jgi:hypothetical protein
MLSVMGVDMVQFKKDSGMLPGMALWGERKFSPLERMWTRPALTVIALEARQFQGSSNQIIEAARARGCRCAPCRAWTRARPGASSSRS